MFKIYSRVFGAMMIGIISILLLVNAAAEGNAKAPAKHSSLFNRQSPKSMVKLLSNLHIMLQLEDVQLDTLKKSNKANKSALLKQKPIRRLTSDVDKRTEFNGNPPPNFKKAMELDSSLQFITNIYSVDGSYVNEPYDTDLDDYLLLRKGYLQQQIRDSLTYSYDLKKALTGNDINKMISQATGMTIPLPPNPVLNLFGKPTINIDVRGTLNLKVGWRWDSQNMGVLSKFGQTQSSPIFHQDIKFIVSGGIGDKLRLSTDWNTQKLREYDNKFKVGYEGEDDEIIKLVELGNVNLPTQSSLIGGAESLFGVRADFQFGPVFLKTIFSQKRGEKRIMDVRGGSSKQPFSIRPYDYSKKHFFIDTAYFSIYDEYFSSATPVIPSSPHANYHRVKEIEVWEATADPLNNNVSAKSIAIADLPPRKWGEKYPLSVKTAYPVTGEVERGNFIRLDSMYYRFDRNLGTLNIRNLRQDRYYAVAYRIEGPTTAKEDDIYYGTFASDPTVNINDTLVLKLIYRPAIQPSYKTLWNRMMKNVYPINASNVNLNETTINIWYYNPTNDSVDILPDAPDKLVTIFKVDQTGTNGAPPGDGQFDLRPPFFDPYTGEITLPHRKPFADGLRDYFDKQGTPQLADKYMYTDVYDTTYEAARLNTARDRFVISGEVSGRATNRINIGFFNIPRNSVKVYLDGMELHENVDYTVDYDLGSINLINSRATIPNANLRIEYESQDIMNMATKTLMGIRADYQLFKTRELNTNLGMTLMRYSLSSLQDRARISEEPFSNTMFGFDFKTNWDTPWLTKALDFLPLYETKAPSNITLRGEWAMTMPTPNKKYSDVTSDNGAPVVYLDDFEGALRNIPLGTTPYQWRYASAPEENSIAENPADRNLYRGHMIWYTFAYPRIEIHDVWPQREVRSGFTKTSGLYVRFDPKYRGIYNNNPEYLDPINPQYDSTNIYAYVPENKQRIWGGIQKLISSYYTNFDQDNIEFIEITMKPEIVQHTTKVHIDLGLISEDVIPNMSLNTEDGITEANPIPNNIIDPGEDVGIDQMSNEQERQVYPSPLNLEPDPARDDFRFDYAKDDNRRDEYDFERFNNFEGNATSSEAGRYPDTEILNAANGQALSTTNSYFSYEINMDTTEGRNPQIVGGNREKGYLTWRIPVRKPTSRTGNPSFSNIQYARFRVQGGFFKAIIVDWKLVGSQWQRNNNVQSNVSSDDSTMSVEFVNVYDNSTAPTYYTMPPGVKPPKLVSTNPNDVTSLNEQSLSISVKNLRHGDERLAVKYIRPLDLFNYKLMKFFIHGDGSMPYKGTIPTAYSIFRFGIDSSNYYEYRRPIFMGWEDVSINLVELAAVKQARDSAGTYTRKVFPVPNQPGAFYAVKGNPVLTRVQFLGFGIANSNAQYPDELTTTMWVNELRLLNPESSNDWAALASADVKLADLGNINASVQYSQPNFHRLEERFGNRATTANWSVAMNANVEKLLPKFMRETKLPISYSHSEDNQTPQYMSNSDIEVENAAQAVYRQAIAGGASVEQARFQADEIRKRSQSIRIGDNFALSGFRLGIPIRHWLITETINKVVMNFSHSQEFQRNPNVSERFFWNWRFNAQYSLSIPEKLNVKPLSWLFGSDFPVLGTYSDWKINFLPNRINTNLTLNRSRTTEQSRFSNYPSPVFRNFGAERMAELNWKLTENGILSPTIGYGFTTNSSLVPLELDEFGRQRTGSEMWSQILFNKSKLVNFGTDVMHTQRFDVNLIPRLPFGVTFNRMVDMTGSYMVNYNWNNPMLPDPLLADRVKNAMYNKDIRFKFGIRMKNLGDMLIDGVSMNDRRQNTRGGSIATPDTTKKSPGGFLKTLGDVIQFIFFDYDRIDVSFNQNSSAQNPGVFGSSGLGNFFGGFAGNGNDEESGPSMAYQLGLVADPHGSFSSYRSDGFPFVGFRTSVGRRPPNGVYQDAFRQSNNFDAKTSRELWKGARIDINWNTTMQYNKLQTVMSDSLGIPSFSNIFITHQVNRTFFSLPSLFGINIGGNPAERVIEKFEAKERVIDADQTLDTLSKNVAKMDAISDAFYEGLETFSLTGGTLGRYLPAMNWRINWEGLEKFPLWSKWVRRMTFDHAYTSRYMENYRVTDNGRVIDGQSVETGFSPLIGLNATFDEKQLDGILNVRLLWNSRNNYMLSAVQKATLSRTLSEEIQLQAGYTMKGFEFPLLGISLKNDFEVSMLTSYKVNKTSTYDLMKNNNPQAGRVLTGNKQIVVEPRATYTLSNVVRISAFFRYEGTFNEGVGSPGFTTTQVGMDIRISLEGGR